MAPTIALKDGKPAFTIGSPGGATIITTVLQTIVNHVDLGMPMDKAIDAPRLSQRNARETSVEPGFAGTQQARGLENFGHKWEASPAPEEIGAANAIVFNPDGTVTAVSEGRLPQKHGGGQRRWCRSGSSEQLSWRPSNRRSSERPGRRGRAPDRDGRTRTALRTGQHHRHRGGPGSEGLWRWRGPGDQVAGVVASRPA
jgi:hypothetical protein